MAIDFKSWLAKVLGIQPSETSTIGESEAWQLLGNLYIRELAFWSCYNLVANALSKCEFKTYVGGKEKQGREWYLWNVSPNKNQNSTEFLHKLLAKLYRTNEALVIEQGDQLLVADSYQVKEYALYDDVFSQVTVGDFTFARSFNQSEVMHFRLAGHPMRPIVDGLYTSYQNLIAYSMDSYRKSRGTKAVLEVDAQQAGTKEFNDNYAKLKNEDFRKFLEQNNALLPLFKGVSLKELGPKTYSNDSSRDIRAMIDDVSDFTARAFCIPPPMMNGSVQDVDSATNQFLTFGLDPLADNIAEEANRKRSGFQGMAAGNYMIIDTKAVKHVDLLSVSAAIDKLIASGAFCINDIRKVCGEAIIDEPWAWQHFITKNYATVEEFLTSLEGGTK